MDVNSDKFNHQKQYINVLFVKM